MVSAPFGGVAVVRAVRLGVGSPYAPSGRRRINRLGPSLDPYKQISHKYLEDFLTEFCRCNQVLKAFKLVLKLLDDLLLL